MPKYQINNEAISAYLEKNPIELLSISDDKPINFNLKIAKSDLALLDIICDHFEEGERFKKRSELVNYMIENLIINAFTSIKDDYVQWKMAETVDDILKEKHNFYGKEKFSWCRQFIGTEAIVQLDYNYNVDPIMTEHIQKEHKKFRNLLKVYLEKV